MVKIGKLVKRITTTVIMLMLALAVAMPHNASVTAAAAVANDDFNRCSLDTTVWTFENPGGFPSPSIAGRFEGNSALRLSVPAGAQASFSNTNRNAPRVMQTVTDTDQSVEVKFNSPLGRATTGAWKIQGLLFRDTTSVPGSTRWLRFELNTNAASINYYVGYLDEANVLHKVSGPNVIAGNDTAVNTAPLYLRVRYVKATNTWSVGYRLGDGSAYPDRFTFTESAGMPGLTGDFVLSGAGVFAGQTGTNPPGITALVDYFKNTADTLAEDANAIKVTKAGTGQGSVNWPAGAPCSGNRVTLTATPAAGSRFTSWTGSVTSTQPTIELVMTQPYNLTATFTGGDPVEQPFKFLVPYIRK
jgi:hypothetical protein